MHERVGKSCELAACAAAALGLSAARLRFAQTPALQSSTRPRRSIRCRTSASNGRTWSAPDAEPDRRTSRRPLRSTPAPIAVDSAESGVTPSASRDWKASTTSWRWRHPSTSNRRCARAATNAANAAQIDRRSRADAELLAELLRSRGYYRRRGSSRGSNRRRRCSASSSRLSRARQYTFQSVELPGLDAAGEEARALRQAFAVKAGRPGHRRRCHRRRHRAPGRARRAGVRAGRDRRAGHRDRP